MSQHRSTEVLREPMTSARPRGIETLLDRLDSVRATGERRWIARCPAHEDNSPSLAIRDDGGTCLIHCFSGCSAHEIVTSIGLHLLDLFPPRNSENRREHYKFDARDVLSCLAKEALIVRLYAEDVIEGLLTDADIARIRLAESRIAEGCCYVG